MAACSVAKNQLPLSLIKSLYRSFTVNKDPSGLLSRIVPSSSIEAANANVRIQRRRLIPKIVCMVVLPLWASKRSGRHARFNTEGHSPAAVLLVGVVQLGLNLEFIPRKISFWQPRKFSASKIKHYTVLSDVGHPNLVITWQPVICCGIYRAFQVACTLQKRSRDQTDQSAGLVA